MGKSWGEQKGRQRERETVCTSKEGPEGEGEGKNCQKNTRPLLLIWPV